MEERICKLKGCGKSFQPHVHNMIYCCSEHTRIATNANILEQYHKKKNRKMGGRICSKRGCSTVLSIYNEGKLCGIHEREAYVKKLRKWGWTVKED